MYTAASIFLLQVQAAASGGQDEITMRRLGFCVAVLERVKGINAGEFLFVFEDR